ncbi:TIGR02587 family membrane protein [Myxosarcina sp. GI1]|uniref:TIGR02587 family membrane protein n=1 Tax=Myxosarcina sp. GI1 TaxID=1541065 RepID=UPI00055C32E6|nr:TIGR02587 family membrane protein [Myxosarcina sp. GI1]
MTTKHPDKTDAANDWSEELGELISGASGGFLFGIPLIYTMEIWFIGSYVRPPILLGIIAITFVVIFLLNQVEGFRRQQHDGEFSPITESIEALAIGIVCSTVMLIVLQRVDFKTSLIEALGKIIFEAVPFALGVVLSRSILTGEVTKDAGTDISDSGDRSKTFWHDTFADLSATLIGAIIIAFNIAPTDEVPFLAAAASPFWSLLIILSSLIISYGIVFASGFTNQAERRQQQGLFQSPRSETIISYLISLLASAVMLWFFQRLSFEDPWTLWLRYSIILGLPASIGGAAGRLAI